MSSSTQSLINDYEATNLPKVIWYDADLCSTSLNKFLTELHAHVSVINTLEDAENHLKADPSALLYVLHPSATSCLCRGMLADLPPSKELVRWSRRAQEVINLYRHNRARIKILLEDDLLNNPQGFIDFLELPKADTDRPLLLQDDVKIPNLLTVIATHTISQNHEIKAIIDELTASTYRTAADSDFTEISTDQAFIDFNEAMNSPQKDIQKIYSEVVLLREHLSVINADFTSSDKRLQLSVASEKKSEKEDNVEKIQTLLQSVKEESLLAKEGYKSEKSGWVERLDKFHKDLESSKDETDLLRNQLKHINEELHQKIEHYAILSETTTQERLRYEERLAQLSQGLGSYQAEKEAWLKRLNKSHNDLKVSKEEADLLKNQLKHINEELHQKNESYSILSQVSAQERARYEERLAQLNQGLESYQAEKEAWLKELNKSHTDLKSLTVEADLLRSQIIHMNEQLHHQIKSYEALSENTGQERARYEKKLSQLNQGLENYQVQIKESEMGKSLLLKQIQSLHDIRSELDEYYNRSQAAEHDLNAIKATWLYKIVYFFKRKRTGTKSEEIKNVR